MARDDVQFFFVTCKLIFFVNNTMRFGNLLFVFLLSLIALTVHSSEKRRWPELVGTNGGEAVAVIEDFVGPDIDVVLVEHREVKSLTIDYRTDRIRVHVNKHGLVSGTPTFG